MSRIKTILYENTIDWDGKHTLFQRPQQLLKCFSENGWHVYFVNKTKRDDLVRERVSDTFTIYHNFDVFLKRVKEVDIHFISWAARYVEVGKVKNKIVIYDSLDNFPEHEHLEPLMLHRANIVLTSSLPLYNLRIQQHSNVHLVRNAVDYNFINSDCISIPNDLKSIPKPFALFSGAIGNWVDVDLMEKIAKKIPLVIIGLPFGNRIPQGKNIYYLGKKDYKDLPKYYNNADLAIIPFKRCQVSDYASPIKKYEYLAAGLPVVSTNIPECTIFPEVVFASKNEEQFFNNINRAIKLSKDKEFKLKAKEIAKQNTWEIRFRQIKNIIDKYCQEKNIKLGSEL